MTAAAGGRHRLWNEHTPPEKAYKARPGMTRTRQSAEQDRAAGGKHRRAVPIGDGRYARASIALRLYQRTRRIRSYLRWSVDGRTQERYVGEVDAETRAANLTMAWEMARTAGHVTDEVVPERSSASSPSVRAVMSANKGKDTKPERLLRTALHRSGLRYRVGIRPVPKLRRTADVVFPKAKVAIFVDGCFWHGCPEHHRPAKINERFWSEKIKGNRDRDAETNAALRDAGWTVIRVWEHEDLDEAAKRIRAVVT